MLNEESVGEVRKSKLESHACALAEECGAPLCPLFPGLGVWFHGEPICRSRKHGTGLRWLRVQRRIARLGQVEGSFTIEDLGRIRKVRRGIRGRNPDAPADRHVNGLAQRREASRDGAARGCGRDLDSEPRAETSQAVDTLSASLVVPSCNQA